VSLPPRTTTRHGMPTSRTASPCSVGDPLRPSASCERGTLVLAARRGIALGFRGVLSVRHRFALTRRAEELTSFFDTCYTCVTRGRTSNQKGLPLWKP